MIRCSHDDCAWRSIAPSREAARRSYSEHLVSEHARSVDVEVPAGMVQIRLEADGAWITTTLEEARELHRSVHRD